MSVLSSRRLFWHSSVRQCVAVRRSWQRTGLRAVRQCVSASIGRTDTLHSQRAADRRQCVGPAVTHTEATSPGMGISGADHGRLERPRRELSGGGMNIRDPDAAGRADPRRSLTATTDYPKGTGMTDQPLTDAHAEMSTLRAAAADLIAALEVQNGAGGLVPQVLVARRNLAAALASEPTNSNGAHHLTAEQASDMIAALAQFMKDAEQARTDAKRRQTWSVGDPEPEGVHVWDSREIYWYPFGGGWRHGTMAPYAMTSWPLLLERFGPVRWAADA